MYDDENIVVIQPAIMPFYF